jgi:hypothetical protein
MRTRIQGTKPGRPGTRAATICDLLSFFDAFAARSAAGEEEKRLRAAAEAKAPGDRSALAS